MTISGFRKAVSISGGCCKHCYFCMMYEEDRDSLVCELDRSKEFGVNDGSTLGYVCDRYKRYRGPFRMTKRESTLIPFVSFS